jgi:hypothetical protein
MSEAAEAVTEVVESQEAANTNIQQAADTIEEVVTRSPADPGYDPIDLESASPEQVKTRLNYLYKQAKQGQKLQSKVREFEDIMARQSQVIEDLHKGQIQLADHLQGNKFAEVENQLRIQKQQAYEAGDYAAMATIDDKLMEVKIQKANNANKPKPQIQQRQPQQQPGVNQYEYDEAAEYEGKDIAEAWRYEADATGNLIRPWAERDHPDFQSALAVTLSVLNNPSNAKLNMQQKLAIVDQRMGLSRKPSGGQQTVMNGGLNTPSRAAKITITPEMEKIAIKTRFGGPNAKTNADHIAAYRKQLEKFPIRGKK